MNKAGAIIRIALRAYSRPINVGTKGKTKILSGNNEDVDIENCDFEDTNEFESDFMNVHISHAQHEKEERRAKEMLKNKITERKYFKESSPKFLTFAEKQQIQTLHENDPQEWTIERLSESFPALPDVIKKVLRSKWSPRSVESVIKHDTAVAENWEKFRAGKLALDLQLRTHLSKFKDRKILLENREELIEKLIPPKVNLPKPQSKLFSSIVKNYVDENDKTRSIEGKSSYESSLISESVTNSQISRYEVTDKREVNNTEFNKKIKKVNKKGNLLMFNDFIKKRLEKIYEGSPEQAITLLDVYRKQLEAEALKNAATQNETESIDQSETSKETFSTKESASTECNKDAPLYFVQEDSTTDYTRPVNTETVQNGNIFTNREMSNEKELLQVAPTSNENVPTNIANKFVNFVDMEGNYIQTCVESKLQAENACGQPAKQHAIAIPENNFYVSNKKELESKELDTHIQAWHKKSEDNVDYTLPIKIPKKIHKEGMTYRVKDCYYDDSGQFLYRVPGLKG